MGVHPYGTAGHLYQRYTVSREGFCISNLLSYPFTRCVTLMLQIIDQKKSFFGSFWDNGKASQPSTPRWSIHDQVLLDPGGRCFAQKKSTQSSQLGRRVLAPYRPPPPFFTVTKQERLRFISLNSGAFFPPFPPPFSFSFFPSFFSHGFACICVHESCVVNFTPFPFPSDGPIPSHPLRARGQHTLLSVKRLVSSSFFHKERSGFNDLFGTLCVCVCVCVCVCFLNPVHSACTLLYLLFSRIVSI